MYSFRLCVRNVTVLFGCACFAFGQEPTPPSAPPPEKTSESLIQTLWNLPIVRLLTPMMHLEVRPPVKHIDTSNCAVAPLDPIVDAAAQRFEVAENGVDISGMLPAAARALGLFQARVAAVGGSMVIKSAYRPAAYQQHLENVWYTWMKLRRNTSAGCQELRAVVQEEFLRHHLLESQHPVAVSDHTRGLAFDATVALPKTARGKRRRRISLDGIARLAGLMRPAIASDPVHFKYVGASPIHVRRRHNA